MTDLELALLLSPKNKFERKNEEEFWIQRARIAKENLTPKRFWLASVAASVLAPLRLAKSCNGKNKSSHVGLIRKGKVRLHPIPEGAPPLLAAYIGGVVAGAIKDCVKQHPLPISNRQLGLLVGSTRKRAVNQLVCEEGRHNLKTLMEEE